jgi:hypothetical protein
VPGVFRNLVIINEHATRDARLIAFMALSSAWLCLALTTIVVDHARDRFGINVTVPYWFWTWSGLLYTIPPFVLLGRVYIASRWNGLVGLLLGILEAFVLTLVVDVIFHYLDPPPALSGRSIRHFVFPGTYYLNGPRWLQTRIVNANPLGARAKALFRLVGRLGPGYIWPNNAPPELRGLPYPEHLAATVAMLILAVFWVCGFYSGWSRLSDGQGTTGVPTLAYLEILLLLFALFSRHFVLSGSLSISCICCIAHLYIHVLAILCYTALLDRHSSSQGDVRTVKHKRTYSERIIYV